MVYKRVGQSGLRVSIAGLGCNNFGMRCDETESRAIVEAALDAGIVLFDTARSYGGGLSEQYLGRALEGHRDEVVIATKFASPWEPDLGYVARASRQNVLTSVERSLRALRTDYIDLLMLHVPNPEVPIDETLAALEDLKTQGKVRYIGCSNSAAWMIADAYWIARNTDRPGFICVENEWNLLSRSIETEICAACHHYGVGIIPYFPLASGMLTGKVRRGQEIPAHYRLGSADRGGYFTKILTDENYTKIEALEQWGSERGLTLTEVALSWLASQPLVPSVIAGATSPDQVRQNVKATAARFSAEELSTLGALVGGASQYPGADGT
jgi:aryl-alcohol dehydrogenase-like predicted oxidoreductase